MGLFSFFDDGFDEPKSNQLASFKSELLFMIFQSGKELPKECDEIVDGVGEFGFSATNPIPVNGIAGICIYLNRLKAASGVGIFYHRVGSKLVEKVGFYVDEFEIVGINGKQEARIHICPYFPRRSRKAPEGFTITPWRELDNFQREILRVSAFGNRAGFIDDFPFGVVDWIRKNPEFIKTPEIGDAIARNVEKILAEHWYEEFRTKNDSGDVITERRPKLLLAQKQHREKANLTSQAGEVSPQIDLDDFPFEQVKALVLDGSNVIEKTWTVGKQIQIELLKKCYDTEQHCVYAYTGMKDGKPVTLICSKKKWLELRAKI